MDLSFTVHRDDYAAALRLVTTAAGALAGAQVSGNDRVAKLSVVGVGMRSHAGVATRLFEALARESINVRMVSTSEIKISVLVDEPALERSVRSLHAAYRARTPKVLERERAGTCQIRAIRPATGQESRRTSRSAPAFTFC